MRRFADKRLLPVIGFVAITVLIGCVAIQAQPAERPAVYGNTTASLDDAEATAFETALTDENGELTPQGEAFLLRLDAVEAIDPAYRDAVARSVARDGVDNRTLTRLDYLLDSSPTVQQTAFAHGLDDTNGDGLLDGEAAVLGLDPEESAPATVTAAKQLRTDGYDETDVTFLTRVATLDNATLAQARALGLVTAAIKNGTAADADLAALSDTAGDGLLDEVAVRHGLDPTASHRVVADLATALATGGYDARDRAYLDRVAELTTYQGHKYEFWVQADETGLLDPPADGRVTEQNLWGLQNDDDDRLLNAIEDSFGTDPEVADTSGDGYEDHLAWGPLRDLGLTVTPGEPDVHVELEASTGYNFPTDSQRETVQETFAAEPTTSGPVNVHFYECASDRPDIDGQDHLNDRVDDFRTMTGIGAHYLLVSDGPFDLSGNNVAGIAYLSNSSSSWMLVDGSLPERAGAEYETSTLAHELGHSLGLVPEDFEGIDSREVSPSSYRSVMNYNHWTPVTLASDGPLDDYAEMERSEFGSYHTDTDALETMWDEGEIDERVTC